MGSGKYLKRAIEKYGLDNFTKEILHIFDTKDEMNQKEKELVVLSENSYNLCEGGQGGFGFINERGLNWTIEKNNKISGFKNFTKEQRLKYARLGGQSAKNSTIIRNRKSLGLSKPTTQLRSEAALLKRAKTLKENNHGVGTKNSQFGTCWITNGINNKKIRKEEFDKYILNGYYKGRIKIGMKYL